LLPAFVENDGVMSVSLVLGLVYLISELLLTYSTSSRQASTRRSRSRFLASLPQSAVSTKKVRRTSTNSSTIDESEGLSFGKSRQTRQTYTWRQAYLIRTGSDETWFQLPLQQKSRTARRDPFFTFRSNCYEPRKRYPEQPLKTSPIQAPKSKRLLQADELDCWVLRASTESGSSCKRMKY